MRILRDFYSNNKKDLHGISSYLKDLPTGSLYHDALNGSNSMMWIKAKKNSILGYLLSYGRISIAYELINNDTVIVRNNDFVDNIHSNILVGIPRHRNTRYTRTGDIYQDPTGVKVHPWNGMKIDFNGNILNKPPAKIAKRTKEILKFDKVRNNRNSRSRYHNTKALGRLSNAKETGDYTLLEMNDVFKLWNVSERQTVIAHFGIDNILATLDSEVLDSETIDNRPYDLVKVYVPNSEQDSGKLGCLYLRMVNPSTDEIHFEGIANKDTWQGIKEETVKYALAWRDGEDNYQVPQVLT